jgi:hypothetical protein
MKLRAFILVLGLLVGSALAQVRVDLINLHQSPSIQHFLLPTHASIIFMNIYTIDPRLSSRGDGISFFL